jgi:predicted transcriptional regulator
MKNKSNIINILPISLLDKPIYDNIEIKFNKININNYQNSFENQKRKTFKQIRYLILSSLTHKRMTINHIATEININWKTVENHLVNLMGKEYVKEVFSSEYVRIFEITEKGRNSLSLPILKKNKTVIKSEDYELSKEVTR